MAAKGLGDLAEKHKSPLSSVTLIIATPVHKKSRHAAAGMAMPDRIDYPELPDDDDDEEDSEDDITPEEADNQRIYSEAVAALRGNSKRPQEALNEFIETFGRKALDTLRRDINPDEMEMAGGGRLLRGAGGGMADRIRGNIGDQPVLLSDGEFVVPADVVSHLGDGSTDAGSRVLEAMMARVRRDKTGNGKQSKAIDLKKVLPR